MKLISRNYVLASQSLKLVILLIATTVRATYISDVSSSSSSPSSIERSAPENAPTTEATEPILNEESSCGYKSARLPSNLVPTHYDLVVLPDLETLTFEGAVQITVANSVSNYNSNQVILHADESLSLGEAWYSTFANSSEERVSSRSGSSNVIEVKDVCRDPQQQMLVLSLAKSLPANSTGRLHFTFAGQLSDDLRGFYKSAYLYSNGNQTGRRHYAITQFQAIEARRLFPCFDEPALKATFDLSLITSPSDRITLANTRPIYERKIAPDKKRDEPERRLTRFARTPPMSTYLLAFVVGDFDFVEQNVNLRSDRVLKIRVYTQLGKQKQAQFALKTAALAIIELEKYFDIEYPLEKLDLVSVPDFEAGAMENWGLITFKDAQLLVDEENSSRDNIALIAGTVVHELAHQWFGNLVTMKWWNDLWLNEGFATWMEFKLTGELYPDWEYNYYYLLNSHIHALNEDSFRQVHAVEPDEEILNENPALIDDMFDAISYNKAAAIIRILHDDLMGEEKFREAIRDYLSEHRYKNTQTADLWKAMDSKRNEKELIAKKSVGELMKSWINQAGHPLLKVFLNSSKNELLIEQERFVTAAHELNQQELEQRWTIPVTIYLSSRGEKSLLLKVLINDEKETRILLPSWFKFGSNESWFKVNANFTGFYRVQYERAAMRAMRIPIQLKRMSPADRLNVIDETHSLLIANKVKADQLLELLSWYSNEDHGAVINVLVHAYNSLLRMFEFQDKQRSKLVSFGQLLLGNIYKTLKTTKQEPLESSTYLIGKSALLGALININFKPAINDALRSFSAMESIPVELRKPIYKAISRHGSEAQFKRLFVLFDETESREEKLRLAIGMAKANDTQRIMFTWNWLKKLNKSELKSDRIDVLSSLLDSRSGRQFVQKLFENNLSELIALNNGKSIAVLLEELCLSMDLRQFETLSDLFVRHKNSAEWNSSLDYIKRMLRWQEMLRESNAKALEIILNQLLNQATF